MGEETRRALRVMVQALATANRVDFEVVLDEYAQAGFHDPADIAAVRMAMRDLRLVAGQ